MERNRRNFLRGLATVTGVASASRAAAQHVHESSPVQRPEAERRPVGPAPAAAPVPAGQIGPGVVPVTTPDVPDLPWRFENGIKVFDIRVEHVRTEFIPG